MLRPRNQPHWPITFAAIANRRSRHLQVQGLYQHTVMPGKLLAGAFRRTPSLEADIKVKPSPTRKPIVDEKSGSMEKLKRAGLGGRLQSDEKEKHKKERSGSSPRIEPLKPVKMSMIVESPPLVFHGKPSESTGALFSSQLRVEVTEDRVTLEKLSMRVIAITTSKKPVVPNCNECTTQKTELDEMKFGQGPLSLKRGVHDFPFSYLLKGHMPASTNSTVGSLDYQLVAEAVTASGDHIKFTKMLDVKRALFTAPEKHSVRVFPPTNLTAHLTLPPFIHPIGDFPIEMRLAGILTKNDQAQTRWRLRKLNWKIEESQKMVSPACPKHSDKVGGEGKGVLHEDTRTIGHAELKDGWKTDIQEGNVELEFKIQVNPTLKPLCDMESPNGLTVKHTLVVEMVVAEEWAPNKKPNQATPTGAARVLRTQFNVIVTERSGLGISWDEEQPPTYEDVPPSPPHYPRQEQQDPPSPPGYTRMEDIDVASVGDHPLN